VSKQLAAILVVLSASFSIVPATEGRPFTLDDAKAMKAVGVIAAAPTGQFVALEVGAEIIVFSVKPATREVTRLAGSFPVWSPDGRWLAFQGNAQGPAQIHVWNRDLRSVEQVTNVPGGVSPNPFYYQGHRQWLTWSPDSGKLVFTTRVIQVDDVRVEEPPKVRVLNSRSSYAQLTEGLYAAPTMWDARLGSHAELGKLAPGDPYFNPRRMRAIDERPELGLNRLFTVDVRTHVMKQLGNERRQYFLPSWSPTADVIAVIADASADPTLNVLHTTRMIPVLTLIELETGRERDIAPPRRWIGTPHWSSDGQHLAMTAKSRLQGFNASVVYSLRDGRWTTVAAPRGMSTSDLRWAANSRSLLVQTYDRFAESLWRIDLDGTHSQLNTLGLVLGSFAATRTGDYFFTAQSSSFRGRLYHQAAGAKNAKPRLLFDANPQLSALDFAKQLRMTWTNAAGDEVDGIVLLPIGYQEGRRYPLIADVYPRPARDDLKFRVSTNPGQFQAAQGYVVAMLSPRAPHAAFSLSRDEQYTERARGVPGIAMLVDDVSSGIRHLVERGIVDGDRVGIYGHSNGGYAANFLITEDVPVRCAVVSTAFSNLTIYPATPDGEPDEISNTTLFDDVDAYISLSPLFRMNRVRIPIMMMMGDLDERWIPHMQQQFQTLQFLNKDVTFVRYAGEEHAILKPENVADAMRRMDEFFTTCFAQQAVRAQSPAHR
jgi:dipeptidyl aminopeptidase/acylaminoacyl peptidase